MAVATAIPTRRACRCLTPLKRFNLAWPAEIVTWRPLPSEPDAGRIADAVQDPYRDPIWAPAQEKEWFCGLSQEEFRALIYSSGCEWGDQVFNDVSEVLHFDMGDHVRLIAYRVCA